VQTSDLIEEIPVLARLKMF